MYTISDKEFKYISNRIYDYAKINLTEKKRSLVIARLSRRIRFLGLRHFADYIKYLEENDPAGNEFQNMVDALSTNYSHFFREPHHFDFLTNKVLPQAKNKTLNIWSAAASTGQEIYSILMSIKEYQQQTGIKVDYRLFASDISSRVLLTASKGIYLRKDVADIDTKILKKYFLSGTGNQTDHVKVKKDLIKNIRFFKLNLTDQKYHLPLMDIIFLRNAIIYFDKETKKKLLDRLYHYLKPESYLILGHSESISGISNKYYPVGKTIYKRKNE